MLEAVPFDKLLDGGGWAVAFWVVFYVGRMVYVGRLVPWRTHEATVKALEIERERSALLVQQLNTMTDSMETVEALIRALPQPLPLPPARGPRRAGGER